MISRHAKARGISLVTGLATETPETYILSSSYGDENSWEDANYRLPGEKKGHGAFTYALLRGLNGEAAHTGDTIDILNLFVYAKHEVPSITGGKQHPDQRGHGSGFDLALIRSVSSADQQQATA